MPTPIKVNTFLNSILIDLTSITLTHLPAPKLIYADLAGNNIYRPNQRTSPSYISLHDFKYIHSTARSPHETHKQKTDPKVNYSEYNLNPRHLLLRTHPPKHNISRLTQTNMQRSILKGKSLQQHNTTRPQDKRQ